MTHRISYRLATIAVILAFIVILLGAYTRLTDAGLGCPDWPGCYGHMTVSSTHLTTEQSSKAWTEMIHRYAAMTLGIIILVLLMISLTRKHLNHPVTIPIVLIGLLLFQAALGMWTVTLKLHPLVVMGHLIGGLTLLSLLWCLRLQLSKNIFTYKRKSAISALSFFGLIIVAIQISLGVWVSANYAALACIGFPTCNGQLWPTLNWPQAFNLISPIGINYQGGILDISTRITMQMAHRMGALITACYLIFLSIYFLINSYPQQIKKPAAFIIIFCLIQLILGIINVTYLLPLSTAVMHNGIAALLLISVVTLNYRLRGEYA